MASKKKLLSVCIKEPVKPVINVFPNNLHEIKTSPEPQNIDLNFFIPDYLAFAIFEDGSVEVRGIQIETIAPLPINLYTDDIYTLETTVTLNMAKAFVGTTLRYERKEYTEEHAKKQILEELHDAGIKITDAAKTYLNYYENYD